MEYPEPEGTKKDHEVQLLAMHTATPIQKQYDDLLSLNTSAIKCSEHVHSRDRQIKIGQITYSLKG